MSKPNCYECKWRGDLPGDCHSECNHPKAIATLGYAMGLKVRPEDVFGKIKFSRHGIEKGWAVWPFNFDPIWLEECSGFEPTNPPTGDSELSGPGSSESSTKEQD